MSPDELSPEAVAEAVANLLEPMYVPSGSGFIAPDGSMWRCFGTHPSCAHDIFHEASDWHPDDEGCNNDNDEDDYLDCVDRGRSQDLDDLLRNYGYMRLTDGSLDVLRAPTSAQLKTLMEYPEFQKLTYVYGPSEYITPIKRALRIYE